MGWATHCVLSLLFVCNEEATTEIYTYGHTLSLHDALPISVEAVEIEVPDRRRAALVDLHEREGRARHLLGGGARRAGQRTNKGAGERCLAGTEVAEKRDHVARAQQGRQHLGETLGSRQIGQGEVEGQVGRGGGGGSNVSRGHPLGGLF